MILCIWDIQQNNSIIGGIYRISWIFRLYVCMSVSQCVCVIVFNFTQGEFQIYGTLLVRLWDLVAQLVLMLCQV